MRGHTDKRHRKMGHLPRHCPRKQKSGITAAGAQHAPQTADQRRDAFVERFASSVMGAEEVLSIYIGDRLGLYRALAHGSAPTRAAKSHGFGISKLLAFRNRALKINEYGLPPSHRAVQICVHRIAERGEVDVGTGRFRKVVRPHNETRWRTSHLPQSGLQDLNLRPPEPHFGGTRT